jgi:nucleoside transporter
MSTPVGIRARLMVMMFLQFFIWGAWYATEGNYMKAIGVANVIHYAYLVSPIGSIVAPFFLGMVADRFFPVQKVLGVMHILSGIFVFIAPLMAQGHTAPIHLFLLFLLFHMLCYMPTVGLATATAFHLLRNKEREFPYIRVFGTIGWIAAGFLVSKVFAGDTTAFPMRVAGVGGVLMGLYSFTLPHVPPAGAGKKFSVRDILGVDALKELGSRPFYIFLAAVMLTSIPLATYFAYVPVFLADAGIAEPGFKMTFGQMSEVVFLLLLPWFFLRLGVKGVLLTGMLAWILRYSLFLFGAPDAVTWMLILGVCIHGPCYDFVYVAGQVFIDRTASPRVRAQAQGLFVLASYGVGQGVGTFLAGEIFTRTVYGSSGAAALPHWQTFWMFPLAFAFVVLVMFIFGFREDTSERRPAAA